MNQPVLVTGAQGFLGRALCAELERRGVKQLIRAGRRDGDLENPASARKLVEKVKPATVFHLAGITGSGDAARLWSAHVGATINLLDALKPGTRVVVTGSSAEYGDAAGRKPAREDGPTRPLNVYGASKLSQTYAALSYNARGLDVVVARVFNTCGPGAPEHLVPGGFAARVARAEKNGPAEIPVGNLEPRRDFVDARDIARALADLADRRAPSGVYNVCSGKGTRIGDVLGQLLRQARKPVTARRTIAPRHGRDLAFIAGSTAKISKATGWKPRLPLAKSLADTLDWHRERA